MNYERYYALGAIIIALAISAPGWFVPIGVLVIAVTGVLQVKNER